MLVSAEEMMVAGNQILGEVLVPADFVLGPAQTGRGSGGSFAIARWNRAPQFIELHARWALGIVRFGWGDEVFEHRHLVGALGVEASYPGFGDDPLDGYRRLAQDLAGPLRVVLGPENGVALQLAREWTPRARVLP